jgi:hypothetical protein
VPADAEAGPAVEQAACGGGFCLLGKKWKLPRVSIDVAIDLPKVDTKAFDEAITKTRDAIKSVSTKDVITVLEKVVGSVVVDPIKDALILKCTEVTAAGYIAGWSLEVYEHSQRSGCFGEPQY